MSLNNPKSEQKIVKDYQKITSLKKVMKIKKKLIKKVMKIKKEIKTKKFN